MKGTPTTTIIPGVGSFRSFKAACEHEGVCYGVLKTRLFNGYYEPEKIQHRKVLALGIPTKEHHVTIGTFATFASRFHAKELLKITPLTLASRISCGYYGDSRKEFIKTTADAISAWKPTRSVS